MVVIELRCVPFFLSSRLFQSMKRFRSVFSEQYDELLQQDWPLYSIYPTKVSKPSRGLSRHRFALVALPFGAPTFLLPICLSVGGSRAVIVSPLETTTMGCLWKEVERLAFYCSK